MGRSKVRVAIIGTKGIPAKYGGFETLAEYLTKYLGNKQTVQIYCSKKLFETNLSHSYNNSRLIYLPLKANGPQSILYDIISILLASRKNDVLLILGTSGSIIFPLIKFFWKIKLIVNIDGIESKREKWNVFAKNYLRFAEKVAIKYADTIIADNEGIEQYVKSVYNKNPVLIAYGGDHVNYESLSGSVQNEYQLPEKYAFKVCRIEPENNIEMILDAFTYFDGYPIVIMGNWKNSKYGLNLYNKYYNHSNLVLINPIYDQKALNEIRSNCYVYIHGHSAGGTNPSLVEAMYLKLPIISFDVNFNRFTTSDKALYFTSRNQLLGLLNTLSDKKRSEISAAMFALASQHYKWENICEQYNQLF